jgi:hypothetical protein
MLGLQVAQVSLSGKASDLIRDCLLRILTGAPTVELKDFSGLPQSLSRNSRIQLGFDSFRLLPFQVIMMK